MNIKIIIATHKPYWMPSDECYVPVHVGAEGKKNIGFATDNTGDNMSSKNSSYCELTGLYWAWKNLDGDYIGLAHYRRHFASRLAMTKEGKKKAVLGTKDYEALLSETDVILPCKRNYYIETTRSQYEHAHNPHDLVVLEEIISEKYHDYLNAFNEVMNRTSGHRFNMFVMKKDLFDSYCEWLFGILFEMEKRIDISKYNSYNSRVFGFVSERMLDMWIVANNIKYIEQRVLFLENQNWIVKIYNFLRRKISGGVDFER